jgi:hypothetical protein
VHALGVSRRVVLDEFQPAGSVGRPHHHHVRPDTVEPIDLVDGLTVDRRRALTLKSQAEEERSHDVNVIADDSHVIEAQHAHTSPTDGEEGVERGLPSGPHLISDLRVVVMQTVEAIVGELQLRPVTGGGERDRQPGCQRRVGAAAAARPERRNTRHRPHDVR